MNIDIILRNGYIHKHRNCPILNHWRYRSRESGSNRNNLVPAPNLPLSQKRRGQCHKGKKICRRPGIHQTAVTDTQVLCQLLFKFIRIASGSEPELQRRIHKVYHLLFIVHPGSIRDSLPFFKCRLLMIGSAVLCHLIENLLMCLFSCFLFHALFFPPYCIHFLERYQLIGSFRHFYLEKNSIIC